MDRFTSMAVFVAAVETGSLVAAARRMGLSPSMAGKHLSAIEGELGVRLMQRSTRRLGLTEAGQAYFLRCKRILEEIEDADREASDTQHTVHGRLRVTAPVTFGAMHLGPVVAAYLERHPRVRVDVTLDDRFTDLLAEGMDVAIRIGKLPDSDLVARRLAPCRMMFCASPRFFEGGASASLDEVRRAPRLVFNEANSPGDWAATDSECRMHAIDGPLRMASNNMQMLLSAALAGAGVAYGPSFVFAKPVARGDLVALLPDFRTAELAVHAVYPSARHVPMKLRRFIDHLAESFGDAPPWD